MKSKSVRFWNYNVRYRTLVSVIRLSLYKKCTEIEPFGLKGTLFVMNRNQQNLIIKHGTKDWKNTGGG